VCEESIVTYVTVIMRDCDMRGVIGEWLVSCMRDILSLYITIYYYYEKIRYQRPTSREDAEQRLKTCD
jgi:hypothetical protein